MTIRVKRRDRRSKAPAPWLVTGALVAYGALGGRAVTGLHAGTPSFAENVGPAGGQQPVRRFDIPAGTLGASIEAYRQASGVSVQVPGDVAAINAAAISGSFTPEQALRQLLEGTGVAYRFTGPDAVVVELRLRESVEVTAVVAKPASPKYTEPLRDIPQTITVVPQSVIGEQVATNLRDVLRNVTGISIQAGEGGVPAGDNLSIRGFSARTDVFIDGVRDFGGYSRDPYNVDQVEVAKGPSSSFGGRGSTGGSVNLASKFPKVESLRAANIGLGTAAYKRGTLDLNQPLAATGLESAAFRLNAMFTDADTSGRDEVTGRRWGLSPSLAFGLGTPTRLTLSYSHLDQDNQPDYGLPWVPANTNPQLAQYSEGLPPVDFHNYYGLTTRDYEDTVTDLATARVERDLGGAHTLRALGRYGRTLRDSVITAPRFVAVNTSTDLTRQLQSRDMEDTIAVGQLDLISRFQTASVEHALAVGRRGGERVVRQLPAQRARGAGRRPVRSEPERAVPGSDHAHRSPQRGLGRFALGVRVRHREALRALAGDGRPALGPLRRRVRPDRGGRRRHLVPARRRHGERPRGRRVQAEAPGQHLRGLRHVLQPVGRGADAHAPPPSTSRRRKRRACELGTKWDVAGGRLSLSGALFRTDKTNARTPGINPGDPPTVLDGEQRVQGVEVGATGQLTGRWSVFGGYTYMDSEVVSSNTPAEVGKPVSNTPRHSFSLWTTVQLPGRLEVGGGAWYVGDRTTAFTGLRTAPGYWTIDATAARPISRQLTLRVKASNLADEQYVDRVGGGHFVPGPGRSVLVSADVGF